MGCASSKHHSKNSRCRHCKTPYSPMAKRSFSTTFASSEYSSLKFDPYPDSCDLKRVVVDHHRDEDESDEKRRKNHDHDDYIAMEVIEAKEWLKMIDQKITRVPPKTPTMTPPGEPETINLTELMEGLEGNNSPLRFGNHLKSFSFHASIDSSSILDSPRPIPHENGIFPNENVISVLDCNPEVIYAFRKALEDLPPSNPFYLKPVEVTEKNTDARIQVEDGYEEKCGNLGKEKVVLYFTSLRGVRKTYEDCCYVKLILKLLALKIDERDVSMHSGFKQELKELLGYAATSGLPKVFVGETYIGGVEEIRRMHEDGKLEKAFEHCERLDDSIDNVNSVCECCGDIRFMPCEKCSGSCKIYLECEEDDDEEEEGFQRCPDCNENGLVRCPICCSP